MDDTVYKIAIAGLLHDIGKFAERGSMQVSDEFLNNNAGLYQPYYNSHYSHKHAVYTAAFIDHIEKFLPEEFNRGGWGIDDPFINLAAGHHKPETPLQWIITMADRVSSGFDRNEFENYNRGIGYRDYKKTRMLTIFEGISTDEKWTKNSLDAFNYRYPLKELSPNNIFPAKREELDRKQADDEYRQLFDGFLSDLEKLAHKKNIPLWFEHFDSLFMIYASHIPAATVGKVIPDVSLYDHSKMTAALASAIYQFHNYNNSLETKQIDNYEDNKFLIVNGDFYGIQKFIFAEGGNTNKASAKLLRGRSFAVSLLSELAADMLCREMGLPQTSVVLNAAGKFTVVAPSTDETRKKLVNVEDKINGWLIKNFLGEVSIGISFVAASCRDFVSDRFGSLWDRLSKESEKRKFRKIDLNKYGGAVEGYLDGFNNDLQDSLCPYCGKRPSDRFVEEKDTVLKEKGSACKICRDHIYFGTTLVKADRIAVTTVDANIFSNKLMEPLFGQYQVSLDVGGELSQLADEGKLLRYWDISGSGKDKIAGNITVKFINGYVPVYNEDDNTDESIDRLLHGQKSEEKKTELFDMIRDGVPRTFHHISKWALNKQDDGKYCGIEALGVLKADVDNLGLVFACGLKHNSLSRFATLSRQMNYFFSIYLPFVLKTKKEYNNIYTVFAGGDDLFLIGPWNRVIDFALDLKNSFTKYVCSNPDMSISAGISINRPGEPVPQIDERAETALHSSKTNEKNSLTVFGETVNWSDYEKLEKIKNTLKSWFEMEYFSKAMFYRLNHFTDMATMEKTLLEEKSEISMDDLSCLKWRSQFKYNLARNVAKNLKAEEKKRVLNEVEETAVWFSQYGGAMKIPLWQILYNQR